MLNRLRALFASNDFLPTTEVFPAIDTEKIANELRLEESGRSRGSQDQPPSATGDFDNIEISVISRIEELRRFGLENFETNRRIYSERLARAGQASKEVEIVAGTTQNDFGVLVQSSLSEIEATRERLNEQYDYRARYRAKHSLERPTKVFEGWIKVFSIIIAIVAIEAFINSYLFSKGNELGLLGGVIAAVLVSGVNVGLSTLLGYFGRYVNRAEIILKVFGGIMWILWLAFAAVVNFAVAHFRDGLEKGLEWSTATQVAVPSLIREPFVLASIESWLLVGIGIFISVLSFRKGWHIDDPYPGYGRVERALESARSNYESELNFALERLQDRRDRAIAELQEANDEVRNGISDAINALFGQSTLSSHLKTFLEQCDVKTAHLLAKYRDANRASRTTPAPKSFDKPYKFSPFKLEPVETDKKAKAEAESDRVQKLVDATIRDIFGRFESARKEFEVTRRVQGNEPPKAETL